MQEERFVRRKGMTLRAHLTIASISLLLMLASGCSSATDLGQLTTSARVATAKVQSYRLTGTAAYSSGSEVSRMTWQGEYAAPDRHRMRASLEDGRWCEAFRIGEESYVHTSDEPEVVGDEGGMACEVLPISEVLSTLDYLVDFEPLPDEEIDGVECIHYRGSVDADALAQSWEAESVQEPPAEAVDLMRQQSIEIELWVGKEDYLIRQMKTDARLPGYDPATGQVTWAAQSSFVQFYDFNEPIVIEPPPGPSRESAD
jgi:hypothetical protein